MHTTASRNAAARINHKCKILTLSSKFLSIPFEMWPLNKFINQAISPPPFSLNVISPTLSLQPSRYALSFGYNSESKYYYN